MPRGRLASRSGGPASRSEECRYLNLRVQGQSPVTWTSELASVTRVGDCRYLPILSTRTTDSPFELLTLTHAYLLGLIQAPYR